MTKFTPEDLLLYLYKESFRNRQLLLKKHSKRLDASGKISCSQNSMQRLDKIVVSPRTEVVLSVLNYAREQSAEEVK